MKKKGFTLVELLAVIIVLAIVSIIAVPTLIGVIEKTKIQAFRNSVYGLLETSDLYYANKQNKTVFFCNGEKCMNELDVKLDFKGQVPESGEINSSSTSSVNYIKIGNYCAYGTKTDLQIVTNCDDIEETPAKLNLGLINATSNSIKIGVNINSKKTIKEIKYEINDKTYIDNINESNVNVSKLFDNLESNKDYQIKVTATNEKNKKIVAEINVKTIAMSSLTIKFNKTPEVSETDYYDSLEAYLDYEQENIVGYYIKTTRKVNSDIFAIKTCGNLNMPGECNSIDETKNLQSDIWYYFDQKPRLSYTNPSENIDTLYAIATDGINMTSISTSSIAKIKAPAGLYDSNGELLANWSTLTSTYKLKVDKNYTRSNYTTNNADGNSIYYVMNNNDTLKNGTKLIIPSEITKIGNFSFKSSNIIDVVLSSSITSIGQQAFESSKIKNINLPEGLTSIGNYVFQDCKNLVNITLPNSLITIGSYAFASSSITSINIPGNVSSIGSNPFKNCTSLSTITVSSSNSKYRDDSKNLIRTSDTLITAGKNTSIPSGIKIIGDSAFYGCNLSSIFLIWSVQEIGYEAFENCRNLSSANLSSVSELKKIDIASFMHCSKLTSFEMPSTMTEINALAFWYSGLTSVTFKNTSGWKVCSYPDCSTTNGNTVSSISVSNTSTNAKNLIETHYDKYWKRG